MKSKEQCNDFQQILDNAWTLIEQGVSNRKSAFHLPTVASITTEGLPTTRTVVLRGVEISKRELRFHTDRRSAKFLEFSVNAKIALHFYDALIKTQIRLDATTELHSADSLATAAWRASQPASRLCYAADIGPGTVVAAPLAAPTFRDAKSKNGFENFCLVLATVHRLEWLHLAAIGHQRVQFEWIGKSPAMARWLAP